MKKSKLCRIFSFLLALLLVVPMLQPIGVFAADVTTVYIDPANGVDTNAGTEAAPVKTLAAAYSKLTAGGTIVFLSDLQITGNTYFPTCQYPVTLTSKTGAEGIVTTGTLRMQGDTTFKDITVTFNASGLAFISGEGNDLTIDTGVTTVNKSGNQVNLVATKRFDATLTADPTLTVRSGKWDYIYATHGNSITGDITVNLEGGSCRAFSPSYNATVTGNVNAFFKGTAVSELYLKPSHKNGNITGSLNLTLDDGTNVSKTYAGSGTVAGGTKVELVGDVENIGTLTGYGEGSTLTLRSGTWKGEAAEFGAVAIDVAAGETVTLSSPITVDNITCAGTLNFDGVGSLTAKQVTGTVNCTITGRVLKNNLYISAPADADIRFPASYGLTATDGEYYIYDLVNFEGLVVEADSAVKMTFFRGTDGDAEDEIQPYATTTKDGVVSYYFPNIQGKYRYNAVQSGYYTIYQWVYMTEEETQTRTVKTVKMHERAGEWDHSYYYAYDQEIKDAIEPGDELWQTRIPLESPVFTKLDKPAHQMTTQSEMEAFLATLDDANDNMYIYSMGKSATYGLDMPLVIFTETDLSGADTLEEAAALLEQSGLHNVGYKAQMHGDEHAAGEGALNVIKMLDGADGEALLNKINIYVMPRMNPDGAYKCRRNMITRISDRLSYLDPNRDMLGLNLSESRDYLYVTQLLDPIVEMDGHERQHTSAAADAQIGISWKPQQGDGYLQLQLDLAHYMFGALEDVELSGTWYYGDVNANSPIATRTYADYQGRTQLLVETRGIYMGNEIYASRTASHIVCAMSLFAFSADHADAFAAYRDNYRKAQITAGETYREDDLLYLEVGSRKAEEHTKITEYVDLRTGEVDNAYADVPEIHDQILRTRVAPTAYVIPANLSNIDIILELLQLHDIAYEYLPANSAVNLQQYAGTTELATLSVEQLVAFPAGAYVATMNQENAPILALLMEPDYTDANTYSGAAFPGGIAGQGLISADANGNFPIYRYIRDLEDGKISYIANPAGTLTTVYVSTSGSNNNMGTETAPVATLEQAYAILTGSLGSSKTNPGTIVLLDDYTITSDVRVDLPAHTFPVTIMGKTASVKLIFKPTAIGESLQQLAFHGPTTLDNLVFRNESTSKLDYIFACGHKFTVGRGVTTSAASSLPTLVGGDYSTAATDTDMTILGGKWYAVYVGSFRAGHTGTAKLTADGATIQNNIRGKYANATTGNFVIDLKNTTFKGVYPGYTGDVSGTTAVTLRENVTGAVYTNNGSSGNITGTVSVVIDGADLSKITFGNTSDTVIKDVLVFASGTATPVAGFSEIHIGTETTVTLGADLAIDKIYGGGVVEMGSYKLTGSGAVSAEVKSVSLRPGAAGLYFTGQFQVTPGATYGMALSTVDETPVAEDNTTSLYTAGYNSVLLKDIMTAGSSDNKENANLPVYARAYIKLSDGTVIYGEAVQVNFRQLVHAVDAMWDTLTAAQRDALKAMYETFTADMKSWQIPNIKKA